MFAKASQLPALLESEKLQHEETTKQLKRERAVRDRQFKTYYKVKICHLGHSMQKGPLCPELVSYLYHSFGMTLT